MAKIFFDGEFHIFEYLWETEQEINLFIAITKKRISNLISTLRKWQWMKMLAAGGGTQREWNKFGTVSCGLSHLFRISLKFLNVNFDEDLFYRWILSEHKHQE